MTDGKPRNAKQITDALGVQRHAVNRALQVMQGEPYRHLALVAIHLGPPDVRVRLWTITGAGRLSIRRREVSE